MKLPRGFLRRVAAGTATPAEVFLELRMVTPADAKEHPEHPWWSHEGKALLDGLLELGSGSIYFSPRAAVCEALRTGGCVLSRSFAGLDYFRVLSAEEAESVVVEEAVAEAMPSVMANPERDRYVPPLKRYRELVERRYLHHLMTKHAWSVSAAAREARVARQTLHQLLTRNGVSRPVVKHRRMSRHRDEGEFANCVVAAGQ